MSRESSQNQASAIPKSQPKELHNADMNRKAAQADIPQGPVKNQNKSAGGFSRDN